MKLEGSCYCGAVHFSVQAPSPYPYMYCYCTVCRKTAGATGAAINLGADAASLAVTGEDHLQIFRATLDGAESSLRRHFCGTCGSALWCWDSRWPDYVHPFASAIDTPLPTAPERCHIMLDFAPSWVPVPSGDHDPHFAGYPDQSLEEWHRARGLYSE